MPKNTFFRKDVFEKRGAFFLIFPALQGPGPGPRSLQGPGPGPYGPISPIVDSILFASGPKLSFFIKLLIFKQNRALVGP